MKVCDMHAEEVGAARYAAVHKCGNFIHSINKKFGSYLNSANQTVENMTIKIKTFPTLFLPQWLQVYCICVFSFF